MLYELLRNMEGLILFPIGATPELFVGAEFLRTRFDNEFQKTQLICRFPHPFLMIQSNGSFLKMKRLVSLLL
jgi:hypothetical protein